MTCFYYFSYTFNFIFLLSFRSPRPTSLHLLSCFSCYCCYTFLLFHSWFFIHFRSFSFIFFSTGLYLSISITIVSSFTTTAAQTHRISFGMFEFCMILFLHQFSFCFVLLCRFGDGKAIEISFLSLLLPRHTHSHVECNEQTIRSK